MSAVMPTFGSPAPREVSSRDLAQEWRSNVSGWLDRLDWDDMDLVLFENRERFMQIVATGDAATVGAFILGLRQQKAEELARMFADTWGRK